MQPARTNRRNQNKKVQGTKERTGEVGQPEPADVLRAHGRFCSSPHGKLRKHAVRPAGLGAARCDWVHRCPSLTGKPGCSTTAGADTLEVLHYGVAHDPYGIAAGNWSSKRNPGGEEKKPGDWVGRTACGHPRSAQPLGSRNWTELRRDWDAATDADARDALLEPLVRERTTSRSVLDARLVADTNACLDRLTRAACFPRSRGVDAS